MSGLMEKMAETETKPSEMTHFEVITALKSLQNDFNKLRTDFQEARELLNERLADFKEVETAAKTKLRQLDARTAVDFKNLAKLKAMGINPKGLLSISSTIDNGEKTQEE